MMHGHAERSCSTAGVMIVAFNMGPSLKRWQWTGHYRTAILEGGSQVANRVKL